MSKLKSIYRSVVSSVSSLLASYEADDKYWALALSELDSESRNKDLWAKCLTKSKFNESEAKSQYVKLRARQLSETSDSKVANNVFRNFGNALSDIIGGSFEVIKSGLKFIVPILLIIIVIVFASKYSGSLLSINSFSLITEVDGIKLGESINEVLFKHKGFVKSAKDISKDDLASDVEYSSVEEEIDISFVNGNVEYITYWCRNSEDSRAINDISCGNSSETILSKFKNQVSVVCSSDKEWRGYFVSKYGVGYFLSLNKVEGFLVAKPEMLSPSTNQNLKPCTSIKLDD